MGDGRKTVKLFYIVDKPERMLGVIFSWHSLGLDGEKILVCVDWKDDTHEFDFAQREGVIPLPHPIFQMAEPLNAEHLSHLGQRFSLEQGHNIHHLVKKAAKEDFWMRLHVL